MWRENGFWTVIAEVVENYYNFKYLHLCNAKCYCLMLNISTEYIFLQMMMMTILCTYNIYIYIYMTYIKYAYITLCKNKILISAYILIAHVPVRPLAVRHHFPHDNAVAPHITGWGELPVGNRLGSRPANGDFPSLWICEWVGEHEILEGWSTNTESHTYERKREGEKNTV